MTAFVEYKLTTSSVRFLKVDLSSCFVFALVKGGIDERLSISSHFASPSFIITNSSVDSGFDGGNMQNDIWA